MARLKRAGQRKTCALWPQFQSPAHGGQTTLAAVAIGDRRFGKLPRDGWDGYF